MSIEGFMFENAGEALEFYERCITLNAETVEEKKAIMRQLVKEKKAKYLRDVNEVVKGKKIMAIKRKTDE